MSRVAALRTIASELDALSQEKDIDPSQVKLAATRIGAQAEMIELGLDK